MPTTLDPARNLLFGLLALQTGLINQAQLVAAFHAWTQARDRPMAGILAEQGAMESPCVNLVEGLVVEHLRRNGSDPERSLAAIGLGQSTRECLARIGDRELDASLGQVGSRSTQHDHDRTESYSVGTATSDGLRFRVLRPHAHGGLGAVFVALDTELHREVALKQILDSHADDDDSRRRFLIEAEITGGLEHPGIVPVYGLGTYGDGRPYYAMRFIRGGSLKEAIERFHADPVPGTDPGKRSLELRKLLRRFTDVCNAIEYAHSRGVLHRDLKPGNVIVGKHGETLVVDWGLAKAIGHADPGSGERTLRPASASGSGETLPGSALGTPAYMSPEQARGDLEHLGPSSDVYSLGATLYYLVTGKPPFAGDAVDVIPAVERGDFRPPRVIDPSIDQALEAVCLKAMALRPEDRYSTCRALAEDIERWMADEPVSAWREPLSRRAQRWARRNRPLVSAAVAAVLVALAGLGSVLAVQRGANRALAAKNTALDRANTDLREAGRQKDAANTALAVANKELTRSKAAVQARYDLAFEAIRTLHTGVSEHLLLNEDQFKPQRDRLLKSASDFYGKLGALLGKETDVASRRALAQSNFELAELTRNVGRIEAALAAHRAVLEAREALAAEPMAGAGAKADVGRSLTAISFLLEESGKTNEALEACCRSESLLAEPARTDPAALAALAACRTRIARLLLYTGKPAEAVAACKLARADQEALAAVPGALSDACSDLAATITELGMALAAAGKPAEAELEYRAALEIQQKLADENPAITEFHNRLATSHFELGVALWATAKPAEAEVEIRKAMAVWQKLAADNPAVWKFRNNLAVVHQALGSRLYQTDELAKAEAEFRTAMAISQKLAHDNPASTDFRGFVATSHCYLGGILSVTGNPTAGENEYRKALVICQKLADEDPASIGNLVMLAGVQRDLGIIRLKLGKPTEAEAEYRKALAIYQKLADDVRASTGYLDMRAYVQKAFGAIRLQLGKPTEAEAEYRKALALYQKLADDNPKVPRYRLGMASALTSLADAVRLLGRAAEARDGYERAIDLQEHVAPEDTTNPWFRTLLPWSLRRRGLARRDLGDNAGAAADARRALVLYHALPPRDGDDWFERACCHAALCGLSGHDGGGVSAAEADVEAARAIAALSRAASLGHWDAHAWRTDTALAPLRSRDDFRLLMMDVSVPAEPFAPPTTIGATP
jgi:serine/threonine protein kinase/tetratricopeptide (TPR) repeat protein